MDAAINPATLGNDVERKLRQEAAKMGADAVVVVYDRHQPMGAYVMGGYWDRSIETVTGRNVVNVAIKYRHNSRLIIPHMGCGTSLLCKVREFVRPIIGLDHTVGHLW